MGALEIAAHPIEGLRYATRDLAGGQTTFGTAPREPREQLIRSGVGKDPCVFARPAKAEISRGIMPLENAGERTGKDFKV
jgi:hypothetical protein